LNFKNQTFHLLPLTVLCFFYPPKLSPISHSLRPWTKNSFHSTMSSHFISQSSSEWVAYRWAKKITRIVVWIRLSCGLGCHPYVLCGPFTLIWFGYISAGHENTVRVIHSFFLSLQDPYVPSPSLAFDSSTYRD